MIGDKDKLIWRIYVQQNEGDDIFLSFLNC